jgi:hypothetical protein
MAWFRRMGVARWMSASLTFLVLLWLDPGRCVTHAHAASPPQESSQGAVPIGAHREVKTIALPTLVSIRPLLGISVGKSPAMASWRRFPIASARSENAAADPAGEKPLYKKTWFLVGAAGLAAVAAILIASGGGDGSEPSTQHEPLPPFPPPPTLLGSACETVGTNGPSR